MKKLLPTKTEKKRRKILRWVTRIVITLIVLLIAFAFIAPRFINTDAIRSRITAAISEAVKGDIRYERIGIRLLPLPRISVEQINLAIPDVIEGKAHFLAVYPEILPLFSGTVRLSKLILTSPQFRVYLADGDQMEETKPTTSSSRSLEGEIEWILALALVHAPDMRITVKSGNLTLARTRKPDVSFQAIQGDIIFPPKGLKLDISGKSSLFNSLAFTGTMDPLKLAGQGRMALSQLDLNVLLPLLGLDVPVQISDRRIDLDIDLTMDGPTNIHAKISGSLPEVTLIREDREIVLKGKQFAGSLNLDGDRTQVTLDNLDLDYPEVELSGELLLASASPRIKVSLKAEEVEIPPSREFALDLAGDVPTVQTIFSIVKEGQVPQITFQTQGDNPGELGDLKNMVIEGSLQDGKISIPETDFNPENVFGHVRIAEGILVGTDLIARIGNSQGSGGTLRLDLNRKDVPFRLDLGVEADLRDVPPILNKYIKDDAFLAEMAQITGVQGKATGQLVLDSGKNPFEASVDITSLNIRADYERIPHPLSIESGQFSYRSDAITVRDIKGTMGKTTFSGLELTLGMENKPTFNNLSGEFSVALDQIYPWLSKALSLDEKLQGKLTSVKGDLNLSVTDLRGPAIEPPNWEFDATGSLQDITLETTLIPEAAKFTSGGFTATREKLTLTGIQTAFLDSTLDISGNISDYLAGFSNFSSTLIGTVGLETEQWLMSLAKSPPGTRITAPISLKGLEIDWNRTAGFTIQGNYSFQDGPGGSIDAIRGPESLEIRELTIEDSKSNSTVGIRSREKILDLDFSGTLFFSTLDDILTSDMLPGGQISGDLNLRLPLAHPMNLSAKGHLQGSDVSLPPMLGVPVTIEEVSLTASEKTINIETARASGPWNTLFYSGKIYTSNSGLYVEGELTADTFDLADALNPSNKGEAAGTVKAHPKETESDSALKQKKSALWDLPLRGQIRFSAKKVELKRVSFEPVIAYISFTDDDIEVRYEEANMCGISFPGTLHATPKGLSLDFQISAEGQELKPTIACLSKGASIMNGNFDLDLNIAAEGGIKELIQSLQGNLVYHAYDGFIFKSNMFTGIFSLLNLTQKYSGNIPDMEKDGFSYKSLLIKSDIKDGNVVINEGILDSSIMKVTSTGNIDLKTMQMDLRVLVAPLRLLNSIARLPILKQIFGGQLAAIPMQVTGDIANPNVQAVSAAAAGGRVLDIMTNTLMLPVTMSEELVGGSGEEPSSGERSQESDR